MAEGEAIRRLVVEVALRPDSSIGTQAKAIVQSTRDIEKAFQVATKAASRNGEQTARAMNGEAAAYRQSARVVAQALKEISQAEKERAQAGIKSANQLADQVNAEVALKKKAAKEEIDLEKTKAKETARAQQQSARDYERGMGQVRAANRGMVETGKMALEGVTALARGMVLLGAASKEDAEAMMRYLVKWEAAIQVTRGLLTLVQATTRAYSLYKLAVEGAALAHAGLAAAQVGGGLAGGAAGASGGLARTAAGYGAAGFIGWGASKLGGLAMRGGALAMRGAPYIGLALAGEEAVQAIRGEEGFISSVRGWREARRGARESEAAAGRIGAAGALGRAQAGAAWERTLGRAAIEAEMRAAGGAAWEGGLERRLRGLGLSGDTLELQSARMIHGRAGYESAAARRALRGVEAEALPTTAMGRAEWEGRLEAARQRMVKASQDEADAARQRLGIEERISQTKIAAARESVEKARQEITVRQEAGRAAREASMSAMERFGRMRPGEQEATVRALQHVRAGERLDPSDLAALERLGTQEATEAVGAHYRRVGITAAQRFGARGAGFGFLAPVEMGAYQRNEQRVGALQAVVRDQLHVQVELKRDNERLAQELLGQIDRIVRASNEELRKRLEAGFRRQQNERAARDIAQESAKNAAG